MEKPNITRNLLHIVSKYSNWQPSSIQDAFRHNNIYASSNAWIKFIRFFLMSLGVAFLVSGIIFFFAYNWASLHKFVKLGLVQGLIIAAVCIAIFSKFEEKIKGVILMGAGMLVGALFAVFGQIYQTGANAYDFFLGWTVFVALWVFVAQFFPLWMMFLTLINVTVWQYFEQVMGWRETALLLEVLVVINMLFFGLLKGLADVGKIKAMPRWMERTIILFSIFYLTVNFIALVFDSYLTNGGLTFILGLIIFPFGVYYGLQKKDTFYIATIGLSIIVIITALLTRGLFDSGGETAALFFIGMFVIGSVTGLIFSIINLNKKWNGIEA